MLKRIIMGLVLSVLMVTPAHAMMGGLQGRITPFSTYQITADNFQAQQRAGLGAFPQGLTFYKDFTKVNAGITGTFANSTLTAFLNANYSVGSPINTFTATNSSFTLNSGYSATTANADVLKYLIAGNRTAATETIVIKFTPTGDFANDGVERYFIDNETSARRIYKTTSGTQPRFGPNMTESSGVIKQGSTTPLSGVTYIVGAGCDQTPLYGIFMNGSLESGIGSTAWTVNTFGTNFFIGSDRSSVKQLNAVIKSVCFFNRFLSNGEFLALNGLM